MNFTFNSIVLGACKIQVSPAAQQADTFSVQQKANHEMQTENMLLCCKPPLFSAQRKCSTGLTMKKQNY